MAEPAVQATSIPDYKSFQTQMGIVAKFSEEDQEKINSVLSYINDNNLMKNIDLLYMLLDNIALLTESERSSALDYFVPKKMIFGGMDSPLIDMLTKNVELGKLILQVSNLLKLYLENPDEIIAALINNNVACSYLRAEVFWEAKVVYRNLLLTLDLLRKDRCNGREKTIVIRDAYMFTRVLNHLVENNSNLYYEAFIAREIEEISEQITKEKRTFDQNRQDILEKVANNLRIVKNKDIASAANFIENLILEKSSYFTTGEIRIDELAQNQYASDFYNWANDMKIFVANPVRITRYISEFLDAHTDKNLANVLSYIAVKLNGKKEITEGDVKIFLSQYRAALINQKQPAKQQDIEISF